MQFAYAHWISSLENSSISIHVHESTSWYNVPVHTTLPDSTSRTKPWTVLLYSWSLHHSKSSFFKTLDLQPVSLYHTENDTKIVSQLRVFIMLCQCPFSWHDLVAVRFALVRTDTCRFLRQLVYAEQALKREVHPVDESSTSLVL